MANIKITDLSGYTDPESTDVLPIVDVTNDETKKVSIADLMENAGSGTEAAPGIAFDGDPNTGIYRPGADQLAISTGGTQRLLISDTGAVTIPGDLTVQGTTTTIDTETLVVKDKNIEMGSVATPTDTTADGGGITLKGATDKTINWVNATDAWTSSERFDFPAGTQGAPSIILNGDVNSGIYQPGADQVAISTGGTGRLFIDASGNVQLETGALRLRGSGNSISADQVTATYLMFAVNSVNALQLQRISNAGAQLRVTQFSTGATAAGYPVLANIANPDTGIFFPDSSDTVGITTGANERLRITSTGELQFKGAGTNGSPGTPAVSFNGSAPVNSLVIDSTGKVGLGTNTPAAPLHLMAESSADGALIQRWGYVQADINNYYLTLKTGVTPGVVKYNFSMRNNSTDYNDVLVLDRGNVGIGTTSPGQALHVLGKGRFQEAASSGAIAFIGADATAAYFDTGTYGAVQPIAFRLEGTEKARIDSSGTFRVKGAGTAGTTDAVQLNGSAPSDSLIINGSGNVGLGTSSPGAKLDIASLGGASGVPAAIFRADAGTGNSGGLALYNSSTDVNERNWYIAANTYAFGDFAIRQGSAQGTNPAATGDVRFYISREGNVGIGTTSPGEKLHVVTSSNKDVRIADASHNTLTTGLSSAITFSRASDGTGNFGALFGWNNGGIVLAAREEIVFANGGATTYSATNERARIDSSGRLLVGTDATSVFDNHPSATVPIITAESDVRANYGSISHNSGSLSSGAFLFGRSRSGSVGGRTIVLNDDQLGRISFQGADGGTEFVQAAEIVAYVDGTPGAGTMPGRLVFSTTSTTPGASPSPRMTIKNNGNVGIGTENPLVKLDTEIDSNVEWTSGANLSNSANLPFVGLNIKNADTSITGTESSLLIQAGDSGSAMHSLTVKRTGTNAGDLIFRRRNGGSGSAESMRIDNGGVVLIGQSTTSSSVKLSAKSMEVGTKYIITDSVLFSNQSSVSLDLSDYVTSPFQTQVIINVVYARSTSQGGSSIIHGYKAQDNTWSFSTISNVGGDTATASGSSNTITVTFSAGAQYGRMTVQINTI